MAYYDALIAAWNGTTQPPTGVTGTGLTSSMTTDQKIVAVNGWTVQGPAKPMLIPGYEIYSCLNPTEFQALSGVNQQFCRDVFMQNTVDCSPGKTGRTVLMSLFPAATTTRANLIALAALFDTPALPWTTTTLNNTPTPGAGLNGPVTHSDTQAAGLS